MKLAHSPIVFRRILVTLWLAGMPGLPAVSWGASATLDGARLLQKELPARVTLLEANGEQLAAAVGKATLLHPPEASTILRVALTRGLQKLPRSEQVLPCPWAKRIFSVSVATAPTQASALLDVATELYPDCATELAGALRDYDQLAFDYKDRVNDKNVVDGKNGPVRASNTEGTSDSAAAHDASNDPAASQNPGDLSERDITGLGYGFGDAPGFGTGFGPGFPGSPGFVGSTPSGGIALPPVPVTAAVNS